VTSIALLDVNVLVALFDSGHVHHEPAHAWFAAHRSAGWATCPLTENGVIRILANPAYSGVHEPAAAIAERLRTFCASGQHTFWSDSLSLRDHRLFAWSMPVGWRLLTDVYLLGLAKRHEGRLATFDRHIPLGAVTGADARHLALIPS
jgi:hypothetical protein